MMLFLFLSHQLQVIVALSRMLKLLDVEHNLTSTASFTFQVQLTTVHTFVDQASVVGRLAGEALSKG